MTRAIYYTPESIADLRGIIAYLDSHSATASERLTLEIDRRISSLALLPELGRVRSELLPGIRSVVVGRTYLIFYRFDASSLEIVRILHGARDLDAEFSDD